MRAKYEAQLKTELSEVYTQLDEMKAAHEELRCSIAAAIKEMESEGQITANFLLQAWAIKIKRLLDNSKL